MVVLWGVVSNGERGVDGVYNYYVLFLEEIV